MFLVRRCVFVASHSFRRHGMGPNSVLLLSGFCSAAKGGNLQHLTLANLGFEDDARVGIEATKTAIREGVKWPERRILEQPQQVSVAAVAEPSLEEKKEAALEASNILAGIAGMQLPRPKKLACEQVALKEVASEGANHLSPVPEKMEQAEQRTALEHPWPEWLDFLEHMYSNDFFEGAEQGAEDGKHVFESYAAVRHAGCGFGRTHADIFRSLSRKDLRVVASYGCPDLERKASNASKRLRAHFRIPEAEVCQHCRLKMTCPRAFLAPPQKLPMSMLDVVRIITGFAMNVWPNADCFTSYPKELETAVCSLLTEILTFNGLPTDPKDVERSCVESVPTKKKVKNSYLVDQKPGDWTCPNCEFLNFNRNRRCRECRLFRPPQRGQKVILGDWECSKCRYLNFSKNMRCRECNADRLSNVKWAGGEHLLGDLSLDSRQCRIASERKREKYEASEDEGTWESAFISSVAEASTECNASFTDEEDTSLSEGLSNAASRRNPKVTFRWNEDQEEEEGFSSISPTRSKTYEHYRKTFKVKDFEKK